MLKLVKKCLYGGDISTLKLSYRPAPGVNSLFDYYYNSRSNLNPNYAPLMNMSESTSQVTSLKSSFALSALGYNFLKNAEGAYHHATPISLGATKAQGPCGLVRPKEWFNSLLRDPSYSKDGKTFTEEGSRKVVNKAIEEDFSKRIESRLNPQIAAQLSPNLKEAIMSVVWNCSDKTAASLCDFINKNGLQDPNKVASHLLVYSHSNNPNYTKQRRLKEYNHFLGLS